MPFADYLIQPGEMTLSPEAIDRKRKIAQILQQQGMDSSPVQSWTQGAARLVSALSGNLREASLDKQEAAGRAAASKAFSDALSGMMGGGGVAGALANPSGSSASAPAMPPDQVKSIIDANVPESMRPYAYRMAQKESGFRPDAVSPTGAKGLFQFTGGTWGDVTGQSVGRAGDNRTDPIANTRAFVALTEKNRSTLRNALGREPTDAELAVAHQQGAGGAIALLTGRGTVDPRNLAVQAGNPKSAADIMAYYGYGGQQGLTDRLSPQAAQNVLSGQPGPVPGARADAMAFAAPDSIAPAAMKAVMTDQPGPVPGARTDMTASTMPMTLSPQAAGNVMSGQPGPVPGARLPVAPGAEASGQSQGVSPQAVMQAASSPQVQAAAQQHAQTPQGQALVQQASAAPMASLMAAMANPWMTDGQRAVLMMVAKQKMEQMNPQYGFQTTPDGTILRTNPRDGTVTPIYQAQPKPMALGSDQRLVDPNTGKELVGAGPGNTDATKNYNFYVQQETQAGRKPMSFDEYQTALKRAGATAITNDMRGENAFDVGIGQKQSAMFSELSDDGRNAKVDLGNIRQLRKEIAKTPGGFLGGAQAFANSWGLKLGPNVDSVEAASSLIDRLTPAQRQGMPGAASDRDVAMFKGSLLKLSNTPGGNEKIATTLEALAQHRIRMAEIANKVITGRMTRAQGMDALEALPDPFEAVRGDMEGASTPGTGPNGQPTNLQSPAEQGLRQIDTSRPGRFRYNPATGQLEPE